MTNEWGLRLSFSRLERWSEGSPSVCISPLGSYPLYPGVSGGAQTDIIACMSEGPGWRQVILKGNGKHPLSRQRCLAKTVQNLLMRASLFFSLGKLSEKKVESVFPRL